MTTTEGNQLIAEFMGIRFNNGNAYDSNGNTYMRFRSWSNEMARDEFFRLNKLYHNSCDWLMPVVKKIGWDENVIIRIDPSEDSCYIGEIQGEGDSLIEMMWNAVVEYIEHEKTK